MTDATVAMFDAGAADYDALRRKLIPPFDAFYGTAVAALALAGRPLRRVLDLGAGTGLLGATIARAYPHAELTLLDGSPAMIGQARRSLGDRARYVTGDLTGPLPPGPWDAIVSALAIHHLDDNAKRDLLQRTHAALSPGGMFVNAEQVKGPTAMLDAAYVDWHERGARALGASAEQWAFATERQRHDRLATVEKQLLWLREGGFEDVDCLFKDHRFAVLFARRGAAR
jgi:tRNA (cmo5U34)-methyltransferase